jgi:hypothetical protein
MWMSVPEDWTPVVVILNVLILLALFCATVILVIPDMVYIAMVSRTIIVVHFRSSPCQNLITLLSHKNVSLSILINIS